MSRVIVTDKAGNEYVHTRVFIDLDKKGLIVLYNTGDTKAVYNVEQILSVVVED